VARFSFEYLLPCCVSEMRDTTVLKLLLGFHAIAPGMLTIHQGSGVDTSLMALVTCFTHTHTRPRPPITTASTHVKIMGALDVSLSCLWRLASTNRLVVIGTFSCAQQFTHLVMLVYLRWEGFGYVTAPPYLPSSSSISVSPLA
jgi:hypothetical protein